MAMDDQNVGRVLLVDDEENFCMTTAGLLSREGYHCESVNCPDKALTVLPGDYDLLITDLHMPGKSGLEFLEEIHQRAPELPMIVVTGYPSVETAVEAIHLSVVDYLQKPLKVPELYQSVAKAIKRGRLMRAVRYSKTTTEEWSKVMDQLEQSVNWTGSTQDQAPAMEWTLDRYLEQTMTHLAKIAGGIQQTMAVLQHDKPESRVDMCTLLGCPRSQRYEGAIRETVAVLEKTKRAFKSKDLGELRQKLEQVLEDSHKN